MIRVALVALCCYSTHFIGAGSLVPLRKVHVFCTQNCNYLPGSGLHVAGWMALPLDQSVLAEGTSALLWSRNAAFDKLQGVCPCSTQEEEEDGTDSSSGMRGLLA